MEKKPKKIYESKKNYAKLWNEKNINVTMDRELIEELKTKIGEQTLKSFLEDIIRKYIKQS
jgi:hypothetical protein